MIQFVEAAHIDRKKWDACIAQSPAEVKLFNYSWYLDATCPYWCALVEGDYEKVFPLPTKKQLGAAIVYQPFFSRQLGVYGEDDINPQEIANFFQAIPDQYKYLQIGFEPIDPAALPTDITVEQFPYQALDLNHPYETLRANYSKNAKRSINKAGKSGFTIQPLSDPQVIVDLFQTTKGGTLKVFKEEDYQRLVQLMHACITHRKGEALGVFLGDQLQACGFYMYDDRRVVYLKGAANEAGKKAGAMYLLFDHVIKQHAQTGKVLDFGGSKVASVAEFYKKFGAIDAFYLFLTQDHLPGLVAFLKKYKNKLLKSFQ